MIPFYPEVQPLRLYAGDGARRVIRNPSSVVTSHMCTQILLDSLTLTSRI